MAGRIATVTYTVKRKPIPIPTLKNTEVEYTGKVIDPGWNNYDKDKIVGEFMSGVDSRDYTASFRPASNYCWPDGSVATKTADWKIKAIEGPVLIPLPPVPVGPTTTAEEFYSYVVGDQLRNYSAVGDAVSIPLSGTFAGYTVDDTFEFNIAGFNHNQPLEGSGHYADLVLRGPEGATVDCAFPDFKMNVSRENAGGWLSSQLRSDVCGEFYRVIDPAWRDKIIPATKYTDNTGGVSGKEANVTATQSKIWILAEFEVFGKRSRANTHERDFQQLYALYENGCPITRNNITNLTAAIAWLLRSPSSGCGDLFCYVYTDGTVNNCYADKTAGFAPCFRIGEYAA